MEPSGSPGRNFLATWGRRNRPDKVTLPPVLRLYTLKSPRCRGLATVWRVTGGPLRAHHHFQGILVRWDICGE